MLSTIEELLEAVTADDLTDLLNWYSQKATLQRLGFLISEIDADNILCEQIFEDLAKQKIYPVLLQPNSKQRPGAVDNKWKVDVNLILESDL